MTICNNFKGLLPPPGDTTGFYLRPKLLLMDLIGDHIHTFNFMENKNQIYTRTTCTHETTGNDISMETLDNPGPFPLILLWTSYETEKIWTSRQSEELNDTF